MANKKGIFCLETASWGENLAKGQTSYEHFLRFLKASPGVEIPHRHYSVATKAELKFYLKEGWKREKKTYPVLLLAFHGTEDSIQMLGGGSTFSGELMECLYDKYNNTMIHFSSCYLAEEKKMEKLLSNTGALSVSGYASGGVDWYKSAAFEMLFLERLVAHGPPDSSRKMKEFMDKIYDPKNKDYDKELGALGKALKFHLWYRSHGKIKTPHPRKVHPVLKKDMAG